LGDSNMLRTQIRWMKEVPLVAQMFTLMFAQKQCLKSVFCVDFPAVFVVLSLKQCRNELPPAVTILLC
jgi:hypothetical protein